MAIDGAATRDAEVIGSFGGPAGERLTLMRGSTRSEGENLRPASLEEVVLGYLASGRGKPGEAAA
jgi:hypothetical protein